jgi:hypothetical protein
MSQPTQPSHSASDALALPGSVKALTSQQQSEEENEQHHVQRQLHRQHLTSLPSHAPPSTPTKNAAHSTPRTRSPAPQPQLSLPAYQPYFHQQHNAAVMTPPRAGSVQVFDIPISPNPPMLEPSPVVPSAQIAGQQQRRRQQLQQRRR